jgi:hypothetical protein
MSEKKRFIDSNWSYMLVSYLDELDVFDSITEVPANQITTQEFMDNEDLQEHIKYMRDINEEMEGKFLFLAIIQPIERSRKFTNQYNIHLN